MIPYSQNPYGEARFATMREIRASGLLNRSGWEVGLVNGRPLLHFKGGAIKVIGSSGSGKTSQIAIPMILNGAMVVVVLDLKNGEITRVIEAHCALMGIPLYTVDPFRVTDFPNLRLNLLAHLRSTSLTLVPDVQRSWLALLPDPLGDSRFFDQSGRRFGTAITLGDIGLNGSTSFQSIATLLAMLVGDFEAFAQWADAAAARAAPDVGNSFSEMKSLYAGSPKTFDSITSGMRNALDFMSDPNIQDTFVDDRGADFALDVIVQGGPVIVSMIIPESLTEVLAPLLRAFFSGVRWIKRHRPEAEPVLVMMDESSRLGAFKELGDMFALGRSEGVCPVVFFQDDGQITRNLGPNGRTTLEANAAIAIDLGGGIRDYQTAQNRSLTLGYQTIEVDDALTQNRAEAEAIAIKRQLLLGGGDPIEAKMKLRQLCYEATHRTKMRKPLLAPDELLNLANDQMLVQARAYGLRPILAEKQPYFTQRRFAGHFLPNPNEQRDLSTVMIPTRWGMRRRRVIETAPPSFLQNLPQYQGGRPLRHAEGFPPKPPKEKATKKASRS